MGGQIDRRMAMLGGLAATLAPPAGRAMAAPVTHSPFVPPGFRLAWQDEFDQLRLGAGGWQPYWRGWNVRHLEGNRDQAAKYADDEMLPGGRTAADLLRADRRWGRGPYFLHEVSGGSLKLRAFPVGEQGRAITGGFPYLGAMISGEGTHAQARGYWELRLRLPRLGRGHHFAIWLLQADGAWPPEIDLLEVVGQHPAKFSANTILSDPAGLPAMTFYEAPNGANGWHVLGFERSRKTMRWTVDGRVVREHGDRGAGTPLYLLMSWEIGSKWPGPTDATTPWPAEAEIDYVRIYDLV